MAKEISNSSGLYVQLYIDAAIHILLTTIMKCAAGFFVFKKFEKGVLIQ